PILSSPAIPAGRQGRSPDRAIVPYSLFAAPCQKLAAEAAPTKAGALASRRNLQPPSHRRPRQPALEPRRHVGVAVEPDQLARLVETDQVVDPAQGRDVGDGVLVAHDPLAAREPPVEHAQQPPGLVDVALQRALVLVLLAGELVEEPDLPEHRPDR